MCVCCFTWMFFLFFFVINRTISWLTDFQNSIFCYTFLAQVHRRQRSRVRRAWGRGTGRNIRTFDPNVSFLSFSSCGWFDDKTNTFFVRRENNDTHDVYLHSFSYRRQLFNSFFFSFFLVLTSKYCTTRGQIAIEEICWESFLNMCDCCFVREMRNKL